MDDNIINNILSYTNIKCHSCFNEINTILKLKFFIKCDKFYYCSNKCFFMI